MVERDSRAEIVFASFIRVTCVIFVSATYANVGKRIVAHANEIKKICNT